MNSGRSIWRRWKRAGAAIFITLILVLAPRQTGGRTLASGPASVGKPIIHILAARDTEIVLELQARAWDSAMISQTDGDELDRIIAPGFSQTSAPDVPQIPVKYVTLGIPPLVEPEVRVLAAEPAHIERGVRLASNPAPSLGPAAETPLTPNELTAPPRASLTAASGQAFHPGTLAEIVEVGRLRSQRFVQIRLNPFQYHPEKQELRVHERLRIAVKFDRSASDIATEAVDEGSYEPVIRSLLLNYDQARTWRIPLGTDVAVEPQAAEPPIRFRIVVKKAGVYEITRSDLLTPGQTPKIWDFALHTLQLFEDYPLTPSREVALDVHDTGIQDFLDSGDRIVFFAEEPDKNVLRYSAEWDYWLVAGLATGKRMTSRNAFPNWGTTASDFQTTVRAETNTLYWSNLPAGGGSDAHWYWERQRLVSNQQVDYSVFTPDRSLISHPVAIRVKLVGFSSLADTTIDHYVRLRLKNPSTNAVIADACWDGLTDEQTCWDGQKGRTISVNVASSKLRSGSNAIEVEVVSRPGIVDDVIMVDWVEITYRRSFTAQNDRLFFAKSTTSSEYAISGFTGSDIAVYDITDPLNPIRLSNTYMGSGTVRFHDATAGADQYIAVAFETSGVLAPDDVERVTSEIDLRDPDNAADYLIITHTDFMEAANRLASHRSADFTVEVVPVEEVRYQFGRGSLDPEAIHKLLEYAIDNWSVRPEYLVLIGDGAYDYRNYRGNSPKNYVEPYMAMVDPWMGETADENYFGAVAGSDRIPDIAVGRFPVETLAEANTMVDKVIDFESKATGTGLQSLPQSALFAADDYEPDKNAGNFPEMADSVAGEVLPGSYSVDRVYYTETHSTVDSVKSAIRSYINGGQLFVNYIGHSGIGQWGDEEGFFTNDDVDSLSNAGTYFIGLQMTCLEGSFQDVVQDAVAEQMVRTANKGAVGTWSPTGLGVATGHDVLHREFYNALFEHGLRRVGLAAVTAKTVLYGTGSNLDLMHTFAWLGDPALDTGIQGSFRDINGDGVVDMNDLTDLQPYWHQYVGAPYDQDGNNFINIIDFMLIVLAIW